MLIQNASIHCNLLSNSFAFHADYFSQYHWFAQINSFTVGRDFERNGGSKTHWSIGYQFSISQELMQKQREYRVLCFSFNLAKPLLLDIVIVLIKHAYANKIINTEISSFNTKCYYVQSQNIFKKIRPG